MNKRIAIATGTRPQPGEPGRSQEMARNPAAAPPAVRKGSAFPAVRKRIHNFVPATQERPSLSAQQAVQPLGSDQFGSHYPGDRVESKGVALANSRWWLWCAIALLVFSNLAGAASLKKKLVAKQPMGQSLDEYIQQASRNQPVPSTVTGSLWNPQGPFATLASDYKASKLGDLVTINVIESTSAAASGTAKTQRQYSGTSGISQLFGVVGARSGIQNLISPSSQEALNGQGQTASSSTLTTSLTGTVVAVLPNGFLVVQAGREVEVDNQRQKVVLRGIVRPDDLAQDNSVPSTQVGNLTIEVEGRGVISDGVRRPNALTRAIMKVLGF
jgi:flagellar L-ring protein FlgH